MPDEKIQLKDDSGDKYYFTVIPNYVLNHSSANDQALYSQMKKHAGENGKCFATQKTLMKKLDIGKKALDKSLAYLIEKKWVTFIGITGGKTRPINTYKINDIWALNKEFYIDKKISSKSNISPKISKDKFQKQHKISSESNIEEEPYKEEPSYIPDKSENNKSYKENHYPKEWYKQILDGYCSLKGIEPKGKEWLLLQRECKLMFENERKPDEIIYAMKKMATIAQKNNFSWKLGTIRVRMPELLAGRIR